MNGPRFGPMLLALVMFVIILLIPESALSGLLSREEVAGAAKWQDLSRFRNVLFQDASFHYDGFLPFYGSSTIGIFSRYHPSNLITEPFTPYLQGESACTSIIHVLNLAATGASISHKKMVFMLDPGDFMNQNGMTDQRFTDLYAKLPAYEFMFNTDIDSAAKKKVAAELLRYTAPTKDPLLKMMLEGLTSNDLWNRMKGEAVRPFAYLSMKIQEKQDMVRALQLTSKIKTNNKQTATVNITWDQLKEQASKEASKATENNPYGLLDDYYKKTIEPKLKQSKNSWKAGNYLNSVEYDNFQAIVDILKAEHADPIFILIPRKGAWSDYTGFTKEYRDKLYKKMEQVVTSAGFQVIDYASQEYDPYFMRDLSHLGWTGWVQVDEDLLKVYGKQTLGG